MIIKCSWEQFLERNYGSRRRLFYTVTSGNVKKLGYEGMGVYELSNPLPTETEVTTRFINAFPVQDLTEGQ